MDNSEFNLENEMKELQELQDLMSRIENFNSEESTGTTDFKMSIETKCTN